VTRESDRRGALEALEGLVERGGDADDVLRRALDILAGLYPWAAISFVEDGRLVPGPFAGEASPGSEQAAEVVFQGMKVAELAVAGGEEDAAFLDGVARLVAPYCLVGWDTGGETWEP
jgi:hypothetical protein